MPLGETLLGLLVPRRESRHELIVEESKNMNRVTVEGWHPVKEIHMLTAVVIALVLAPLMFKV